MFTNILEPYYYSAIVNNNANQSSEFLRANIIMSIERLGKIDPEIANMGH